jgi:hypothetical protein
MLGMTTILAGGHYQLHLMGFLVEHLRFLFRLSTASAFSFQDRRTIYSGITV